MYKHFNYLLTGFILLLSHATFTFAQSDDPCVISGYVLSSTFTPVSCNGGSNGTATVASTGCQCVTSGCTFLWDTGDIFHTTSDVPAGTYSVTVTHPNGCILSTSVTVPEADAFVESISTQPASCSNATNGRITITPHALAGQLTYAWSNGASLPVVENLPAGDYTVTVTNYIGCQYVETVTVGVSGIQPTLSVTTSPSCSGSNTGEAHIEVIGGTPPFSFRWNDPGQCVVATAPNLPAGIYAVTVTDGNDCEYVKTGIAVSSIPMSVSATASANTVCAGGTVTLAATGGVSYAWSPATGLSNPNIATPTATVNGATTYQVTVTNADGCAKTAQVLVSTLTAPNPVVTVVSPSICAGQSTQLIATSPGGAAFSWSPATGLSNPNSNAPLATPSQTTTYTLTATNALGCSTSTTVTITVNNCSTAVSESELSAGFTLQPNPATDKVTAQLQLSSPTTVTLQLFNISGQKVWANSYTQTSNLFETQIDIAYLPTGIYYLQATADNQSAIQRLVVE